MNEPSQGNSKKNLTVMLIVDGWGVPPNGEENAISRNHTPYIDQLISKYPIALLGVPKKDLGENYNILSGGKNDLTDIISENGLKQAKVAEVEKYAYLAYFMNNNNEEVRKGEQRIMISSEQPVEEYSNKPEMNTPKVCSQAVKLIKEGKTDLIIISLANLDMVLLSKDQQAIDRAVVALDNNIKKLTKAVLGQNGSLFITSCKKGDKKDKGVPLIMVAHDWEGRTVEFGETPGNDLSLLKQSGTLADIAPTVLRSIGIEHKQTNNILIS